MLITLNSCGAIIFFDFVTDSKHPTRSHLEQHLPEAQQTSFPYCYPFRHLATFRIFPDGLHRRQPSDTKKSELKPPGHKKGATV